MKTKTVGVFCAAMLLSVDAFAQAPPIEEPQSFDELLDQVLPPGESLETYVAGADSLWAAREGHPAEVVCRIANVRVQIMSVAQASLVKLGANPDDVLAGIDAMQEALEAYCLPGGSQEVFSEAMASFVRAEGAQGDQISSRLGISFSEALLLKRQQLSHDSSRIQLACGSIRHEVLEYYNTGVIPEDIAGPNPVFRDCNLIDLVELDQLKADLGLSPSPTPGALEIKRSDFAECMSEATADLRQECNDPLKDGAPSAEGDECNMSPCNTQDSTPLSDCNLETGEHCSDAERIKIAEQISVAETEAAMAAVHQHVEEWIDEARAAAQDTRDLEFGAAILTGTIGELAHSVLNGVPRGDIIDLFLIGMGTNLIYAQQQDLERFQWWCDHRPGTPGCTIKYCPAMDFSGDPGWYARRPDSAEGVREPLTYLDRLDHCMCKHADPIGERFADVDGFSPGMCPSESEREKQECLTDPFGPDDAPRAECKQYLVPRGLDDDIMANMFCSKFLCADAPTITDPIGRCVCGPDIGGTPGGEGGEPCWDIDCGEDAIPRVRGSSCSCSPIGGTDIFGGQYGIPPGPPRPWPTLPSYDTGPSFPGPLQSWVRNPGYGWLDSLAASEGLTSLAIRRAFGEASTPFFSSTFWPAIGTHVLIDIRLPFSSTPLTDNGLIRTYLTAGTVNHVLLGQINLGSYPVEQWQTLDFPLTATQRALLLRNDTSMSLSFELNSPDNAPGFVRIDNLRMGGTLTLHSAPFVQVQSNGDVKYSITLPGQQKYVEVFVQQNGTQNISGNIKSSEVSNGDGTYTYSRMVPASWYHTGDVIKARFYYYKANSPGVFTPGPSGSTWLPNFFYKKPSGATPLEKICRLPNGSMKYSLTLNRPQAYLEAFVQQNGVQNVAGNIADTQVSNGNGTYTYTRIVPASQYHAGDIVRARFYHYEASSPGFFSPGPIREVWYPDVIYGTGGTCPN